MKADTFVEFLKLGRLQLWPITFLTLLVGAASYTELTMSLVLQILPVSILINYLSFAPNEYFDFEIDKLNERKELMGTKISDKEMAKIATVVMFALSFLTAFFLPQTVRISVLTVAVSSILYSVPPFRFKGRAPLDSVCNIVGVFFIFAAGVGMAGGALSNVIPGAYWFSVILGGGAHAILAIPDIKSDKKENLRTMPMLVGKKNVVLLTQAWILLALYFENFSTITTVFLAGTLVAMTYLWKERPNEKLVKLIVIGVVMAPIYLTAYAVTRGII